MAAVTHAAASASTSNASSYTSALFTPQANDLLVVFVVASGTVATGSMTDSQGLGFTKITSALKNSSVDTVYCFVANALAANSSMSVTFDCTGDAATGAIIFVARISGMSNTGSSAVRQTANRQNGAANSTPFPVFAAPALNDNPTLGVVGNSSNPAGMTPPTDWTEQNDTGYSTPTTGGEYVSRDSGFTGTTITWGSVSATNHGAITIEIDTGAVADSYPAGYKPNIDTNSLLRM